MGLLYWLVESPDKPRLEGRLDTISVRDVVELLDEPRGRDLMNGRQIAHSLSTGTAAGAAIVTRDLRG